MGRTVLAEVGGFTPVIDSIVKAAGQVTALVFGRVWRFCQMEDGVCKASLETIAGGVGLGRTTVMKHLKKLCEIGYLRDLTPGLRYKPHVYADTGKAALNSKVEAVQGDEGVPESDTTVHEMDTSVPQVNTGVAEKNTTVHESDLKKVFKKDIEREEEEIEPALDFSNLSLEEARKCPTLSLFEQAAGFLPAASTWAFVDRYIREHSLTKESIQEAAEAWGRRGYRRENVEGILEWALKGVPPIITARRGADESSRAMWLPKPSLLCSDGVRLKESAEERNERGRVTAYWEHLTTCRLCNSASNIEETLRELAKKMGI